MDVCCRQDEKKDAKKAGEDGCCEACPTAGCAGCACSKPENKTGCCMGGGCACGNGR